MTQDQTFRQAALAALAGAGFVITMLSLTILNGVGYQDFECLLRFGTPQAYGDNLAHAAPVLRMLYPIDTLYIFSYVLLVFAMVHCVPERRAAGQLAIIAVLATAGFDFVENNFILAMANGAERGNVPSLANITFETTITQIKFNCGLLLTLSLSFLIPFQGKLAAVSRWLPRAAVVVGPFAILSPETVLIYLAMNIGLGVCIGILYWQPRPLQNAPSPLRT